MGITLFKIFILGGVSSVYVLRLRPCVAVKPNFRPHTCYIWNWKLLIKLFPKLMFNMGRALTVSWFDLQIYKYWEGEKHMQTFRVICIKLKRCFAHNVITTDILWQWLWQSKPQTIPRHYEERRDRTITTTRQWVQNKVKQPALSSSARWLQNHEWRKVLLYKQRPNTKLPQT